ncbi:MAG: hypothetical protein NTW19_20075 [Planctomycetota bacterium]|nr:hypothetical protein [Planctomycetota bacterium]
MPLTRRVLTDAQLEQFYSHGLITLERVLPPDFCEAEVKKAWVRLGIDEHDRSTWSFTRTNMPVLDRFDFPAVAPRAWDAICDLLGGPERVQMPCTFGNNMIVVLNNAKEEWQPPSAKSPGWHKDGDWFEHFLDSPEQALLIIVVWRDLEHRGGGTYFACDSVGEVARHYAAKPQGGSLAGPDYAKILGNCRDFRELTGRQGDIVLMHPYMVHAVSTNTLPAPRVICNVCVSLAKPMDFNRPDPADFSPLETSVLRALGKERFDFQITGQRRRIVPQREIEWAKRRAEEQARVEALAKGKP